MNSFLKRCHIFVPFEAAHKVTSPASIDSLILGVRLTRYLLILFLARAQSIWECMGTPWEPSSCTVILVMVLN